MIRWSLNAAWVVGLGWVGSERARESAIIQPGETLEPFPVPFGSGKGNVAMRE